MIERLKQIVSALLLYALKRIYNIRRGNAGSRILPAGGVTHWGAVKIDWQDVQRKRIGVSDPTLRRMVAKLGMDFPAPKRRHRNGGGHVAKQMTLCGSAQNLCGDRR